MAHAVRACVQCSPRGSFGLEPLVFLLEMSLLKRALTNVSPLTLKQSGLGENQVGGASPLL